MKIALIGYGKMGHEIEGIATARGHEVILKIDESNQNQFTAENLGKADVAIEFTVPASAVNNILKCFEANVPVVSGTTGWMDKMDEVRRICKERKQAFFYASNYSIGVNLFFKLNKYLANLMKEYPHYLPSIKETHHVQKKDAPSGTAITLAEQFITKPPIQSFREGNVPGTHTISYTSDCDEIQITHQAFNRKGFAEGAVRAAEWLIGKKGVFGMNDMLNS